MTSHIAIYWNVRGMGSRVKRDAIRRVIERTKPCVIFFQESKKEKVDASLITQLCGRQNDYSFHFSASNGASGGLITCWEETFFECESSTTSSRYISLTGKLRNSNLKCQLINVYAANNHSERRLMWEELKREINNLNLPTIIGGDFNVVKTPKEKLGAQIHRKEMNEFEEFIEDIKVVDLPLSGGSFTWCSRREDPSFCRLDRFLVSTEILQEWPDIVQRLMSNRISDHHPITLQRNYLNVGPKPFRWFESWSDEFGYDETVAKAVSSAAGKGIVQVLTACKLQSRNWYQSRKKASQASSASLEKKVADLEKKFARDKLQRPS
ncbi:hypothetical protein HRI_001475100 [Hibiscus trionum]|uniref:Endonuclease/exonuclease/phosphatase domain-containing protein n=1 Tax=Hibiscus trionum TaxID=183268 RepID=A0A9W7HIF5_HIBTR|nr:hypothetical protein HRI_001475100 [Hibiscus trionum]